MNDRERLRLLMEHSEENKGPFGMTKDGKQAGRGAIPVHYKRMSLSEEEQKRLWKIGISKMLGAFGIKLYCTQAIIAGAILSGEYDKIAIITPSQYGKLLADDTPVLTKDGWKNHGDLKVGDEVISPNGEFVKVTYVHPKGVANRIVTLENGDTFKCHENHLWYVKDRNSHSIRVLETRKMESRGTKDINGNKFTIPVREELIGEEKKLAVDPYVMGVWLGDGSTTKGQICSSEKDLAVVEECRKVYPEGSKWVHKDTGVITYSLIGLADDLSAYGLCYQGHKEEKYIPDEYLTASKDQRLRLLAGLIDTDGYQYREDGRFYFVTSGKKLKESFEALVSTFGWKVSVVEHEPQVSTSGIAGRNHYWTIGFNPTCDIPCVLGRKRPTRFAKQKGIGIASIEPCEPVQGNCITVEGGLYCVGKHLVTTHNSYTMGMVALLMAYDGHRVNVAGATSDKTDIIMQSCRSAASNAHPEIKKALSQEAVKKVDRLDQSLSKARLSFSGRGSVQGITLGDMFEDVSRNKAVGQGGAYIVDEAAFVSEKSLAEIGRREFSSVDGQKEPLIMISNPHSGGYFYDFITKDTLKPRECVIWMDALTSVQEGRWTKEDVLNSDFADHADTLQRYLLCELPTSGRGMFEEPDVADEGEGISVMGIDAAYRGKDQIEVCVARMGEKIHYESVVGMKQKEWVEGVTSRDIIRDITRAYFACGCAICCVDIGFGVWLLEGLLQNGVNAKGVNFGSGATKERVKQHHYSATNAANLRAEMHLDLADLIENHACTFDKSVYDKIKDILPMVISERKANGKIQVIPKAEIKAKLGHSPDALDAVLLATHAAVLYSDETFYMT